MCDAAHTMIPFKGVGANTTITDACELGQLVVERRKGSCDGRLTDAEGMIRQCNQVMIPRGREIVLLSRAAGQTEGRVHTMIPEKRTRTDS